MVEWEGMRISWDYWKGLSRQSWCGLQSPAVLDAPASQLWPVSSFPPLRFGEGALCPRGWLCPCPIGPAARALSPSPPHSVTAANALAACSSVGCDVGLQGLRRCTPHGRAADGCSLFGQSLISIPGARLSRLELVCTARQFQHSTGTVLAQHAGSSSSCGWAQPLSMALHRILLLHCSGRAPFMWVSWGACAGSPGITEWFGLERTLRIIQSQPAATGRDTFR